MTDRKIFGLVVRLVGIGMVIWGLGYLQGAFSLYLRATSSSTSSGYSPVAYLIAALTALFTGVVFIRAEWLVRFAYGRES
jgi:hypothetical protein